MHTFPSAILICWYRLSNILRRRIRCDFSSHTSLSSAGRAAHIAGTHQSHKHKYRTEAGHQCSVQFARLDLCASITSHIIYNESRDDAHCTRCTSYTRLPVACIVTIGIVLSTSVSHQFTTTAEQKTKKNLHVVSAVNGENSRHKSKAIIANFILFFHVFTGPTRVDYRVKPSY